MQGIDEDDNKMFECFFIVSMTSAQETTTQFQYPEIITDVKEQKQYEKFCFPFNRSDSNAVGQRHQHFAFMLTDLEKRHKYGFCKLVDGGKLCYCVVSCRPWFEIFYKVLNCMRAVHDRNDDLTLNSLLDQVYILPAPSPREIVTISASLTFCVPDEGLPSIPENRNMMEYYSAISAKMMIEIFAALMFERRIIFTSSSLSIMTGCLYSAESLIHPLSWQHIFIPILPPHLIDYCTAPMPFLVGVHSSLFATIKNAAQADGVVIVNVDANDVENPYNDLASMPSDAIAYLRSQLGKPNIAVGSNLSEAFLKTQARIIGNYRSALKFRMGESISFDEQTFIDKHKPGTRRSFAEALVQLQTFHEFIDRRLDMLNNGIGFRDAFENEITDLTSQDGENESALYKEWLSVTKKGGELIYNVKKRAKSNMKLAKQSMRDMKNAMKSTEEPVRSTTLKSRQSLRENIRPMRPPRPPPPRPHNASPKTSPNTKHRPTRPPPPKPPRSIRRYKVIDEFEEDDLFDKRESSDAKASSSSVSLLEEINAGLKSESSETPLLIDLCSEPSPVNVDSIAKQFDSLSVRPHNDVESQNDISLLDNDETFSILSKQRPSIIRKAEIQQKYSQQQNIIHPHPRHSGLNEFFDLSFNNNLSSAEASPTIRNNGHVQTKTEGPLISFDDF